MSRENVEVVQRLAEAFNRGDVAGVLGHDGIREWMANLRGVGGVRFRPRNFTSSGDVVISEWASSGTGEASGVPFEWTTHVVLHMGSGKILRAQAFLSRAEALQAAGLQQ